jgi:hypothetical protein
VRGPRSICVLIAAATALFAAGPFTWNWRKVERPSETLVQARLSESERAALKAALSTELGPPLPNLSAEEQDPDVRIKLLDLNGDHVPEVIAQITGRFWCRATGNCPFRVFRKSGKTYESMLAKGEFYEYQGFTVMQQRSGGYLDLVFNQHESATRQAVLVYKFRDGKYRALDCYEADWEVIGDEAATAKEPRIMPCR